MTIKLSSHVEDAAYYTTAIVSSIPIRDPEGDIVPNQYLLQHHDGFTITKTLVEMDELVESPITTLSWSLTRPSLSLTPSLRDSNSSARSPTTTTENSTRDSS